MKVGVIFGGRSCEHDISIITGVMAANAAAVRHSVVPIYVGGDGEWYTGRDFFDVASFAGGRFKKKRVHVRPGSRFLYSHRGRKLAELDAIIVCCHGANGEDGALAGLLQLCGIPQAGSGVLASAIGMDKIVQKRLYVDAGLDVLPFLGVSKADMGSEFFDIVSAVSEKLTFPVIVKPASLGSSIGIGVARDFKELFVRLDEAFMWDNRVIVESFLEGFVEVNCAVLGVDDRLIVSQIEQPLSSGFLSFDEKYVRGCSGTCTNRGALKSCLLRDDKDCLHGHCDCECGDCAAACGRGSCDRRDVSAEIDCDDDGCADLTGHSGVGGGTEISKGGTGRYLPAHISPEMMRRVREAAKKVFCLLGCSGVARVDFLIKDDVLYVNEINTVPGSLSSYLFAFDGMDFPLLIDKLLWTAEQAFLSRERLKYTFNSDVLRQCGGKTSKV